MILANSSEGDNCFGAKSLAMRLAKIHELQDELTSSPSSHDILELSIATATSLDICLADDSPLVWMIIAGEPSSDKTQTVMALREAPNTHYLDTLTGNSFISGYVSEKTGVPAEDLLPKLDGKCLTIKDLTTLFSIREDKVKEVLGNLASIYDGEFAKATGVLSKSYKSKFSILACVTPLVLRKHHRYMSTIGSRFLINRIVSPTQEEIEKGFEIIWEIEDRPQKINKLRQLVVEHMEDLLTSSLLPVEEPPELQEAINLLAQFLARGRTVFYNQKMPDSGQYEMVDHQTEQPFRAVYQLRNLCRSLARVHGRHQVTDHELELARRVVLSSIPVDRAEMLVTFPDNPEGFIPEVYANKTGKNLSWVKSIVRELESAQIICPIPHSSPKAYQAVAEFRDLLRQSVGPLDHLQDLRNY